MYFPYPMCIKFKLSLEELDVLGKVEFIFPAVSTEIIF